MVLLMSLIQYCIQGLLKQTVEMFFVCFCGHLYSKVTCVM